MRILYDGLMSDKGIVVTCDRCDCMYVIENRNDWIIPKDNPYDNAYGWKKDLVDGIDVFYYGCRCPQCGLDKFFGTINSGINIVEIYKFLSTRDDWKEKYEMIK